MRTALQLEDALMVVHLLLALALACRASPASHGGLVAGHAESARLELAAAATTTTTVMPTSSIEDPSNSATSESSDANDDTYCFSCFDKLKAAKQMIAIQLNLQTKISKLVRQKNQALASNSTTKRPKRNQRNSINSANMTRSLINLAGDKPRPTSKLVSTLRVARAATPDPAPSTLNAPSESRRNSSKITKDPLLKQLGHKKEQQLVETCKMIYEVQQCLSDLSGECLGNLQYHSQDVYIRQWFRALECRRTNKTRSWFANLTRSLPIVEEPEKGPIARRDSSDEKVNNRLNSLLGNEPAKTFMIELKPHGYRMAPQYHPLSIDPDDRNENYFRDWRYQLLLPCFLVLMIIAIGLRNLKREPIS